MDKHTMRKHFLLLATFLFLLACEIPVISTPATSNSEPVSIETIIAGTAGAAQTQTAIVLPPSTDTPTPLPPATGTPTETPTPTATFIFVLPTSTEPFKAYDAGSDCQVIAIEPYNPILSPRTPFDATWTLKNTGDDLWLDKNVDFKHSGGTDMHRTDAVDLPSSVGADGQVDITVSMVSPRESGTFTSNWVLGTNKQTFCRVSVTVIVK